jgi:hypothetical protein
MNLSVHDPLLVPSKLWGLWGVAVWTFIQAELWEYLPTPGNTSRDPVGTRQFSIVLFWVVASLAAFDVTLRSSEDRGAFLAFAITGFCVLLLIRSGKTFLWHKTWAESERGLDYQQEVAALEARASADPAAARQLAIKLRAEAFDIQVSLEVMDTDSALLVQFGRSRGELEQRVMECRKRLGQLPNPDQATE